VVSDLGPGLWFSWAHPDPGAGKGFAFMEALVAPVPSWDAFPEDFVSIFQALRSEAGEGMVLDNNFFVEQILPKSILRKLSEDEMNEYRRPFLATGEGRRPTLTWPRQIPVRGEPADVALIMSEYSAWLTRSEVPKLFVNAEPGGLIAGPVREFVRSWPAITEITVPGIHFIQEDAPEAIGEALLNWHLKISGQ